MSKSCSSGHENPEGSDFCGKCGEPLSTRDHFRATFCPLWPVHYPICKNFCTAFCDLSGAYVPGVVAPGKQAEFDRAVTLAEKYPNIMKQWLADIDADEATWTPVSTETSESDAGATAPATARARLIAISDNRMRDLPDKDSVIIGRKDATLGIYPDIDLSRYGKTIARRHVRIFIENGHYMLENLVHHPGVVRLNGQNVFMPEELHDNDEIRLGGVLFHFKTP